jgi:hypothetical protein
MSEEEFCDLGDLRAMISVPNRAVAPQRVTLTGVPAETRPITSISSILGWDAAPGVTLR